MLILGLNAFHADSSAAILRDGQLIAAAEEERFRRVKHWAGFPEYSIGYCLEAAGATLKDIGHIAVNTDSRANLPAKIRYVLKKRPELQLLTSRLKRHKERMGILDLLAQSFPGQRLDAQLHGVEHHVAHMASAFLVSPFQTATTVSVDGFGDFASTSWGLGVGTAIRDEGRIYFPHSLGMFYLAITQFLGFPNYGDEYKVMGLAPYGQPSRMNEMREIVSLKPDGRFELNLKYFIHHRERVDFEWVNGSPRFRDHFSTDLEALLGPRRHASESLESRHVDIARSAQAIYEEAFLHLLRTLQKKHDTDCVTIAGGCGMNSVANGKIRRATPYRNVYVQAAAGDAGGAIGAAFAVWHRLGGDRGFVMDHAYWGPEYLPEDVDRLLDARRAELEGANCTLEHIQDADRLCARTATAIADGAVVGWFQGRMEWGPRALGNRSILCDPRRADMKEILNAKIKRRESFRPFAPSILEDKVVEWFEENDAVPFMMQVFQIREGKRPLIPAVAHVDGSGRLQTVSRRANPLYYQLIQCFRELSDVPILLNTSFNENEPVVCQPSEALECFLRTRMDILVMGNAFIQRKDEPAHEDRSGIR